MAEGNKPDALEWLAYAEADLGVADHLFQTYQPKPFQIICFHCQQAAEKAVKQQKTCKNPVGEKDSQPGLFYRYIFTFCRRTGP